MKLRIIIIFTAVLLVFAFVLSFLVVITLKNRIAIAAFNINDLQIYWEEREIILKYKKILPDVYNVYHYPEWQSTEYSFITSIDGYQSIISIVFKTKKISSIKATIYVDNSNEANNEIDLIVSRTCREFEKHHMEYSIETEGNTVIITSNQGASEYTYQVIYDCNAERISIHAFHDF